MTRALWTLATLLSHWRRRPMQFAALMIGLTAATALWSGVQALNEQARLSYQRAANALGGSRTAMLLPRAGDAIPHELYIALRRAGWPVSPAIDGRVTIGERRLRILGIEPVTLPARAAAPEIGAADLLAFMLPPGRTLVARETLGDLGAREGSTLETADGQPLPPLQVASDLSPGVLLVDVGVAQRILGRPGHFSRLLVGDPPISAAAPLDRVAGDRLRLVPAEDESDLERLTDSFHLNLTAFGLLSFVVGLFIVNSAIGLAFEQRRPMLRTLRACGVSARMLNIVLAGELILFALLAGVLGLAGGYAIAAALLPDVAASLRGLYGAEVAGELTLRPLWWLSGLGISVVGAAAAAGASLWRAAHLPLLASALPQAWQQAHARALRLQAMLAGACLCAAALFALMGTSLAAAFVVLAALLIGSALALPPLLALMLRRAEGVARHPIAHWFFADGRLQLSGLSLALMALLLALAVNVGVGAMVGSFSRTFDSWLTQRLAADVYLNASDADEARDIAGFLAQRPEVSAILPAARAEVEIGGWPVEIISFADDPVYRDQWPTLALAPGAWDRVFAGTGALISEQLARRLGLGPGDALSIPTPTASWTVTIVGLHADYGNPRGQLGVSYNALIERFPQIARTRFSLRVAEGSIAPLIESLRRRFALSDRSLADQSTVKRESRRIFDRTFVVTTALNAFTLGIAAVALLASLLTLGNARLPQIAPLWAIGVTRRRLAMLELGKTLALALLTAALALPLGIAVAWCLLALVNVRAFGWRLPLHVDPLQLAKLLAVALIAAAVAALIPLVQLLRRPPAELVKVFADER